MAFQTNYPNGLLALSFDDRNFAGWLGALPLFARYNAHATFFISGGIDDEAIACMKALTAAGHTVGLHGRTHGDAPVLVQQMGAEGYFDYEIKPQILPCQAAGLKITSFAYPNCRRNSDTDEVFFSHGFRFVRGSLGLTPYDPEGKRAPEWTPLAENPVTCYPVNALPGLRLINCILMGEAYNTHSDDILNCLKRISEKQEMLFSISHDIAPDAKHIGTKTEWLEAMLATAATLGIAVVGYDELAAGN